METSTTIPTPGQSIPSAYDYRMYDQIWQRVSPDLNPYPDVRAGKDNSAPANTASEASASTVPGNAVPTNAVPANTVSTSAIPASTASAAMNAAAAFEPSYQQARGESTLPGAELNPCCLGTVAQEYLPVLEGYVDEELSQRRYILALMCQTSRPDVRRLLRRFAGEKGEVVKRLRSTYFLITGECYAPTIVIEQYRRRCLTDALREIYHQEACNGFNYQRSADGTTDICLQQLLSELSAGSYNRARATMVLLGTLLQ